MVLWLLSLKREKEKEVQKQQPSKKWESSCRMKNGIFKRQKRREVYCLWPSLNHSLPFPILLSTPFWVFFLKRAGGKTERQGQKEPQRSQSIHHPHSTDGEPEAQRGTVACSRGHSRGRNMSLWAVFPPT